jgi:NAD(P)-dependent dehydrogenase (short-subunit alcohol dehydrogenase family)
MTKMHILITGATQGIGRACAERFARGGWTVTAVARNETRLQQMTAAWREEHPTSKLITHRADLATVAGVYSVPAADYDVVLLNAATFAPGTLLEEAGPLRATIFAKRNGQRAPGPAITSPHDDQRAGLPISHRLYRHRITGRDT